ncbi:MAG: hypothetical protein GY820_30385 [Gammaproteobacteria bacterium]|nr:hypothetical protein [Gammaproteobacteria bacterium]
MVSSVQSGSSGTFEKRGSSSEHHISHATFVIHDWNFSNRSFVLKRSSGANLTLFCRRRHRRFRTAIGQLQRNYIRTNPALLPMSVQNVGSIDHSQLELDAADCCGKVPS